MSMDQRPAMPAEVRQEIRHLKPFTMLIVTGVVLDLLAGALIAAGVATADTKMFSDDLELGGVFWLGVIVGAGGAISALVGLYYLLQGLFTTMASIVYRPY